MECTLLYDAAIFHDENLINVSKRLGTVANNDDGCSQRSLAYDIAVYCCFSHRVYGGCRLVKNPHG